MELGRTGTAGPIAYRKIIAHSRSSKTRKHPATIYSALYTAFDVPRYQELLEAEWPEVEQWFKSQLVRKK